MYFYYLRASLHFFFPFIFFLSFFLSFMQVLAVPETNGLTQKLAEMWGKYSWMKHVPRNDVKL